MEEKWQWLTDLWQPAKVQREESKKEPLILLDECQINVHMSWEHKYFWLRISIGKIWA